MALHANDRLFQLIFAAVSEMKKNVYGSVTWSLPTPSASAMQSQTWQGSGWALTATCWPF